MSSQAKVFFLLLLSNSMFCQINEIGVFMGGSNFIGDVGPTTYISPNSPAIGIIYKWNKTNRHAYRISYTQSKLTSKDINSDETSRNLRGYEFENNIKEVSLGLEFNFFDFDLHRFGNKTTSYFYSGLSYTTYSSLYILNNVTRFDSKRGALGIPMTLGIKSKLNHRFILGIEVGARYTFTDAIDGSLPRDKKLDALKFGNINNNDWYVFSGLTLTYSFGEKPCYCID